jgi:capsular polysaccharide biosynthesis protein
MELNNYWLIIKRNSYITIVLCLVFAGLAYYHWTKNKVDYSGTVTFTIGNQSSDITSQDNFGQFYNLSAASYLADTLSGWLGSPNVVADVYAKAGYPLPKTKLTNLATTIKTTKNTLTSGVVVAQMGASSHEGTVNLLNASIGVVNDQLDAVHKDGTIPTQMTIHASSPVVVDQANNPYIAVLIAAISGIIVGVVISLFVEAVRQSR